jgi:hypothetical protein
LNKVYEGEFRFGKMEGRGVETWADGRRYEGDFKGGKKDGEGTFYWPNGSKYIGSWRNGKQHGLGILTEAETLEKRHGQWSNGKRLRWVSGHELVSQQASPSGKRMRP